MNFAVQGDMRLFESFDDPDLANRIVRVMLEDPEVTSLVLDSVDDLGERAWTRLGLILGQNSSVEELDIWYCNLNFAGLVAGLQGNRYIRDIDLNEINLQDTEKLISLVPFLTSNPSLRTITLHSCDVNARGINILSAALLNRAVGTLEDINLSYNNIGDIDLDLFVQALSRSRTLTRLLLGDNNIGLRGCTSLAKLLANQDSGLERLYLNRNFIDDECAVVLADSLATNTKLKQMSMYENKSIVTVLGWSSILNLVCKTSSIGNIMDSNHTFHCVDYIRAMDAIRALGTDDANLLYASLGLNNEAGKLLVARRKILWSHARGNLNLGETAIDTSVMPRILAWIGNNSEDETGADLIQYHDPPLSKAKIDVVRLDSVYRILRTRPGLCVRLSTRTRKMKRKRELGNGI